MITRVHHIATVVPTLEDGAAIWRDRFGLEVDVEATVPTQGVRAALLPCGDAEIELLQPLDPEGAIARFMSKGGGIHHVCFESEDVGAELARLKAANVRLLDEVARPGLAGRIGFLHPKATHMSLVELATPGGGVETQPYARPKPASRTPFAVSGLDRVTFLVNDLDDAAEVFERNFGLKPNSGIRMRKELGADVLTLPTPSGGAPVELARPAVSAGPDGWAARRLAMKGEGAALLGMRVAALDPGVATLRGEGIVVDEVSDAHGRRFALVDPAAQSGIAVALTEG